MSGGWQPIETAPRDGSECIIYCPETDTMLIAWWDDEAKHDNYRWTTTDGPYFYSGPDGFTFWQPLPEPPVS